VLGVLLVVVVAASYSIKIRPVAESPADTSSQDSLMNAGLDALYTKNDPSAAVDRFKSVLALNPAHYGATYQLATALDRAGRGTEARSYWEKMLKLAESSADEQTLSTVRSRLGRPDVVSEAGHMQIGLDALYRRNNPDAAAAAFREALKQNPTHYGATFQLAMALDRGGKPAEARPFWQKVLEMAEGFGDQKTAEAARARLQKPDTPDTQDVQGALMRAGLDALYTKNDPNAAIVQFRKVLDLNATHYGATFQLAMALDRAGKRSEARPLWQKVLQMAEGYKDKPTADAARTRLAEAR
jgi:tetratricopeptide (TPR) repeat protein